MPQRAHETSPGSLSSVLSIDVRRVSPISTIAEIIVPISSEVAMRRGPIIVASFGPRARCSIGPAARA